MPRSTESLARLWTPRLVDRWPRMCWDVRLTIPESGYVTEVLARAEWHIPKGPRGTGYAAGAVSPTGDLRQVIRDLMTEAALTAEPEPFPGM